jgi:hypothetical protein
MVVFMARLWSLSDRGEIPLLVSVDGATTRVAPVHNAAFTQDPRREAQIVVEL